MKTIYFAGGCFWGLEKYFQMVKGVISTRVGYANGTLENPAYEDLKHGLDDSSETVKIEYENTDLKTLLELYLRVVDPYSLNKQGNDIGIQYRTGIYYQDENDKEIILNYFKEVLNPDYKIEVLPLKSFYDAEEYHQNYLNKNPYGYCHINMNKLRKEDLK